MKLTSTPVPVKQPMQHTLTLTDDEMQILKWVVRCRIDQLPFSTTLDRLYRALPGDGSHIDPQDPDGLRRDRAFR